MKVFVCLAVLFAVASAQIELGCRRSDPDINTCLLGHATRTVQALKNGFPEYNIPPLDPLKLDFFSSEADLEALKIKMVMKNTTLIGHSDAKFTKVKFDPKSLSGEMAFHIPYMKYICTYFATGRLFVIPLESSAVFDGDFNGIDMSVNFRLKSIEKNGEEYFSIERLTMKSFFDQAKIKLTSLNPVNQPTVNVIQDFFNENTRQILDLINPNFNARISKFLKQLIEDFILKVPAKVLLPQ